MILMKYYDTDSLVVLDDQSNSKKFKSFRDIETVLPLVNSYFPIKGKVLIEDESKSFELEPDNPSYKVEWWTDDMWNSQPEGPPKDKDEIFADFFSEMFISPNERILQNYMLPFQEGKDLGTQFIFAKKKFLDSQKKSKFNNIKLLYFYKIDHDYVRIKSELFSLPKSINTENVELLYFSEGQIIDFDEIITSKKFPNLKKLIIDTDYKSLKKFPPFNKLEELYILRHDKKGNKYKKMDYKEDNAHLKLFSLKNLKNLKHIIIRNGVNFNDKELKELYKSYGKKFKIYNESISKVLKKRKIKFK